MAQTTAQRVGSEPRRFFGRPRLSTPVKISTKLHGRRPTISSPIGPVKNSRGPDFTRSKTLIIVDGIKDCSLSCHESLPQKEVPHAIKTTRRISAGFQTNEPLASSPTIAQSDFTATTTCQVPGKRKTSQPLQSVTERKTRLPVSSTAEHLPRLVPMPRDENVPPGGSEKYPATSLPVKKNKLPKSRTMGVLNDLKTSISRPSLTAHSVNSLSFASSSSRKSSNISTSTLNPQGSSRLHLPHSSQTSLVQSSCPSSPVPSASLIDTAQPSAYWTGRFMALRDRFLNEGVFLESRCSTIPTPATTPPAKTLTPDRLPKSLIPTHISYSTTTSALTSLSFSTAQHCPSVDDVAHCKRIFQHLDSLCTTTEAKRSLRDWQQTYARRNGQPALLPQGGCMEERGLINRLFGGGIRKGERRSLSALRETSMLRGGKKVLMGNAAGARGKRRSIY